MQPKDRILFNTGILTLKMLVSVGLALFSTRLVLLALGVDDFGIFSLIAGTIGILSFMNISMASSTQRYLSLEMGRGDAKGLERAFSTSVLLHLLLGILVFTVLQGASIPLFGGILNIPADRIPAAKFIYQAMAFAAMFTIASVPYEADITAHERMGVLAIIGIAEAFFKLGIAIILVYQPFDRLKVYGLLFATLTFFVLAAKRLYCRMNFSEVRVNFRAVRMEELKQMFAFTGWTTMTALSDVLQGQGLAIIFNIFFGTRINATYGIARQVSGQAKYLSAVLLKAASPQTISRIGEGRHQDAVRLVFSVSKASYLLILMIAVPLWIEMESVLSIWLKNPPEHSVWFCRIILITPVLRGLTYSFQPLIHATGQIGRYQRLMTTVQLLVLPAATILLWSGFGIYIALLTVVFAELILGMGRLYYAKVLCGVNIPLFLRQVILPAVAVFVVSIGAAYWVASNFALSPIRIGLTTVTGFLIMVLSSWVVFFSQIERQLIRSVIERLSAKANILTRRGANFGR